MKNLAGYKDHGSFFLSSMTLENQFQKLDDLLELFDRIKANNNFIVNEIPFSKMDQWKFLDNKAILAHESGKFFKIEGIRVRTNFGGNKEWEQPIINQPEIGILGLMTKIFNGTLYFLMQAKMEPGNINILQLSPTVQATKSNFSRVHKGKLPAYLDYFIDNHRSEVLIDQLQSEQGGRFLRKRNRNIIIRVHEEIEVLPGFFWLTLGEIKKLLAIDNFVNMDARSVISTIPLVDDQMIQHVRENNFKLPISGLNLNKLSQELMRSICCEEGYYRSTDQIISWYTDQKVKYELDIASVPLSKLKFWKISDDRIFNTDRYFSVIAVDVKSGTREVTSWTQPLIKDKNIGLLGFIIKKINGIIHFLVQAKVEPGNLDIIELSPTVSCSNLTHLLESRNLWPPFMEYFIDKNHSDILYDTIQSEEGGRFYHVQNRNMIVEIDQTLELALPGNYMWMTLGQMMDFMKYSMFNIEARSLVSSLNFLPKEA